MFASIARFELGYQLKNPVFWVVAILFFLMTFGAVTVDEIQIGAGGNVHVNSPQAIGQIHMILSLFFMFVTTAFVANVIVRDDESGFGPMVKTTRVAKFDYLFARFAGAFAAAALAFAAVPLAIWIGSMMPWLDPETLGPNNPSYYAIAYFGLALPNVFLTAAIFFAVATMTRSMMYSYVGVVVFLVLYVVLNGWLRSKPEMRELAGLIEPFGFAAVGNITRYWTSSDSNTMMPALAGDLLLNRLIWFGAALLALGLAYARFSFAERGLSRRGAAKAAKSAARLAATAPMTVAVLPAPRPAQAGMARLTARTRFEMAQLFRSPAFAVLLIVGLFNAGGSLWFSGEIYGTPARPATFGLISLLAGSFGIIPLIIAIYYAGELVWRDRQVKFHEIMDATPLPNWAYLVPKVLALVGVLFSTLMVSVLAAVLIQLLRGYTGIAPEQYAAWYVLPTTIEMLLLAVLAVFVQALSPNKYVGWGVMVVYLVATITLGNIGFDHPLYTYGDTPSVRFSDINLDRLGASGAWWLRLYWGLVALVLAVGAHLLWRRGTDTSIMPRLRRLPARLRGVPLALITLGTAGAAAAGSYVYYNTNVLNDYRTRDDVSRLSAEYERKYLKYEKLLQPSVTNVRMTVDLKPAIRRFDAAGHYDLVNDTGAPLRDLHLRLSDPDTEMVRVDVPGAVLASRDDTFNYRIYRFAEPLAPGAKLTVDFATRRWNRGFRANGADRTLVENGTFLNNGDFALAVGMDRNGLLADRITRRKFGLTGELRLPKLEDASATRRNMLFNAPWVMSDITVITDAGQTPIAPGRRVSDVTAAGRRTARFVSSAPIIAFFSVQSARYAEVQGKAGNVALTVYHHPDHGWNAPRMIRAMQDSLAYYTANFGPYQFDYARIIEFPAYAEFAQAFAGTVPYSESIGFLANAADPDKIDYVTYITAHELGHQYWGHQLVSADQQGATMLVETLAQYSALMVMKKRYGDDKIRRFLKYELDSYLRSRGSEAIEELPLGRVENQGYIHYRKGSLVLFLLADRLGEARVNAMLAGLLKQYRFKGAPYAGAPVLVGGFKGLARNDAERQLISDLLERITIYDLKATGAQTRKLADGRFETTLTVAATKAYADGKGRETKTPLADDIDVGLFTDKPGDGSFDRAAVLMMERRPLRSGETQLRLVTAKKPSFAGVDPYNKYVDRNSDDNVVAVK